MVKEHVCICGKQDWDVVFFSSMVVVMAVVVSIWQDNPMFLWLLALLLGVPGSRCKGVQHKTQ